MSQVLDLGKVVGSYILTEQDKLNIAEMLANRQDWRAAINAVINGRLDSIPTQGSTNLMTSGSIYSAFNSYTPSKTFIVLTAPLALDPPQLDTELYYSNGGMEANSISITLPAVAAEGAKFSFEFRSTGPSNVHAVITSLEVEEGGRILTNGELSDDAYATKITAIYSVGTWLATIVHFAAGEGVAPAQTSAIVYSGANMAYFQNKLDITRTVSVGANKLEFANGLTPAGSAFSFGNLYGLNFLGWNTSQDGSGMSYEDGAVVEVGTTQLVLFPQYGTRNINVGMTTGNSFSATYSGIVNQTKELQLTQLDLSDNGIGDNGSGAYVEKKIKVKIDAAIECYNEGHYAEIIVGGHSIMGQAVTKGRHSASSDWIELTRESSAGNFTVNVLCKASPGSNASQKSSKFEARIMAIQIG